MKLDLAFWTGQSLFHSSSLRTGIPPRVCAAIVRAPRFDCCRGCRFLFLSKLGLVLADWLRISDNLAGSQLYFNRDWDQRRDGPRR